MGSLLLPKHNSSTSLLLFLLLFHFLSLFISSDAQQLVPSQSKTLLPLLEYPSALVLHHRFVLPAPFPLPLYPLLRWSHCRAHHHRRPPRLPWCSYGLSPAFSSYSLFTTMSRLLSLTVSLFTLGLQGAAPREHGSLPLAQNSLINK